MEKVKTLEKGYRNEYSGNKDSGEKEIPDDMMDSAISLLENDCFPISIICCRGKEIKKKYG